MDRRQFFEIGWLQLIRNWDHLFISSLLYPDAVPVGFAFVAVEFAVAAGYAGTVGGAEGIFSLLVQVFVVAVAGGVVFTAGRGCEEEDQQKGGPQRTGLGCFGEQSHKKFVRRWFASTHRFLGFGVG
jgi:hypothetical protein